MYLPVRRDEIIPDTLNFIKRENLNFKKEIRVKFENEKGIDEGGVRKEYFQILTSELFTINFGMFVSKNEDRYLWFNGHSFDSPYNFELSGICLGLSIYNAVLLDI